MNEGDEEYDVVIVGAGLGGGIAAGVLAEAGLRVLLLERGVAWRDDQIPTDHLRNHRLTLYGDNTSVAPGEHPRVAVDLEGRAHTTWPRESIYQLNAFTVGGGARVWGMQAWRFHPDDFRMATRYGVPAGSSLADWPIGAADLAPFYERAEQEIGVAGNASSSPHATRNDPYPMPGVPPSPTGEWLARGAARLGWNAFTPPLAFNTLRRGGRGPCVECGQCIGFACPTDAKNGSHNTFLPRALATGRCRLETRAHVSRLVTAANGRVTGVEYILENPQKRRTFHQVKTRAVVLAAGAIESARLLLLSASDEFPRGLGNIYDQVGRHLQGHYYPIAYGLLPREVPNPNRGPGVSVATTQFNHGNPGVIGGAMLANDFVKLPIIFWRSSLPPEVSRWGIENKKAMRDLYLRVIDVRGPVQEIPVPESRVTLDPRVRDVLGLPVARLSGLAHPETLRTAEYIRGRAEEWLRGSGAERVWSWPSVRRLSAGQHQAGTCRMSADPRLGVTDLLGRVHGHENIVVCDASLHVTNGGFNPALTVMALALRNAAALARELGGHVPVAAYP